jgi:hypothetical protein
MLPNDVEESSNWGFSTKHGEEAMDGYGAEGEEEARREAEHLGGVEEASRKS